MSNEESLRTTFDQAGISAVLKGSTEARIAELESENMRLHQLVAELLIKNQQLRRQDS